ncbi:MAG: hypothetical protein GX801_02265, partial [Fibrobacter sp.]|nr:hypothetical protein [Fibrobacter sp.]
MRYIFITFLLVIFWSEASALNLKNDELIWKGQLVVLTPDTENLDPNVAQAQKILLLQSIDDINHTWLTNNDIGDCKNLACIDSIAKSRGATGILYSSWQLTNDSLTVSFAHRSFLDSTM